MSIPTMMSKPGNGIDGDVVTTAANSASTIAIASLMRYHGTTGLQTHVRAFEAYLNTRRLPNVVLTPFAASAWQLYPVFGMRKLIAPLMATAGVWWHMTWHEAFLLRVLRRELMKRSDVAIYAQCLSSASAALRARSSASQRVILAVHFNDSQAEEWVGKGLMKRSDRMYRAIRQFEASVLKRVDGLVFVSEFMRRTLFARYPDLCQIPHVVLPNFIKDPGPAKGMPDADLICIGTLEPRKNQGYLIDIVAAALRAGHELRVSIVGDGPDRAMLQKKTRDLGVAHLVRFTGFVPNAAGLIAHHRACVHVALQENLPMTLVEALAYGVPVFATPAGGVPEIVEDGVNGRLIGHADPASAAQVIVDWLSSPERMSDAGAAARSGFLCRFESDAVASHLVSFIQGQPNGEPASAPASTVPSHG